MFYEHKIQYMTENGEISSDEIFNCEETNKIAILLDRQFNNMMRFYEKTFDVMYPIWEYEYCEFWDHLNHRDYTFQKRKNYLGSIMNDPRYMKFVFGQDWQDLLNLGTVEIEPGTISFRFQSKTFGLVTVHEVAIV